MIETFKADITGQLSDKSRVVDGLLDIRLAAGDRPALVTKVDRLLSDVPGLTTVENSWWTAALNDLHRAANAVPMG